MLNMKQSANKLLNKYVENNSEVFTTDGEVLFCKICNKSVSSNKKFLVEQHLRTQKHVDRYTKISSIKTEALEDLLGKYVLESSNVFETDGELLFCKACNLFVAFRKKGLVDQHLSSQKHIESCNEQKENKILSNKELLNQYVSENSDVYQTDGNELFCKICKITVSIDKKLLVYQHLKTQKHIDLYKKIMKTEKIMINTELLNKYVSGNRKMFATNGKELFCKICTKTISFDTKYSVYRHLKSKKHIIMLHKKNNEVMKRKKQRSKLAVIKLLTKYISEYSDVFETDGEVLLCKVCKKSVSFHKKFSVDQHLKTQKHKDNFAQSVGHDAKETLCENNESPLKQSSSELLNKYVLENNDIFETDGEILFCKVCKKSITFDRKSSVEQHLKTQKHKYKLAERVVNSLHDVTTEEFSGENTFFSFGQNEDLCRTCMKQFSQMERVDEKQKITEVPASFGCNTSLMELLEFIQPQIKVEIKENLPTYMCSECIKKLLVCYEFLEMYRNVDKKLRKILEEFDADNCNNNSDEQINLLEEMRIQEDFQETKYEIQIEQINIDDLGQQESEKGNEQETEWPGFEHELTEDAENIECVTSDDDWIPEGSWLNASSNKQTSDDSTNFSKIKNETKKNLQFEEYDDENTKCPQCESVFDTVKLLREHMRQNHVEKKIKRPYNRRTTEPRRKSVPRVPKEIPSKQEGSYQCEYCEKRYSNYIIYKTHMRIHSVESHLCIECGKSFARLSSFNTHMLRHKGEKNYQCPQCPKRFVCSSGLYGHMMVHTNNKPYVCDICGAAFHMAYQLKHHNLYHAGIKKFQCEYCDMRFVTREKQRRHMRTHTGEKPYRCKYCKRAFAQSNDCVKHLRTHLGDNVYQCDLCPLRFPLVRDLRAHFATHKDDDEETRNRNLQARMEELRELQTKVCNQEPIVSDNF